MLYGEGLDEKIDTMTQEERWQSRFNEVKTFI